MQTLNKITVALISMVMNVIKTLRCRTFLRRTNDLTYDVFLLDEKYAVGTNYYVKKLMLDNEYERTTAIKLGNICVSYSIDKFVLSSNTTHKFNHVYANVLARDTINSHNSNSTVVQLKRKEVDNGKRRSST